MAKRLPEWETNDGKRFKTKKEAEKHEKLLKEKIIAQKKQDELLKQIFLAIFSEKVHREESELYEYPLELPEHPEEFHGIVRTTKINVLKIIKNHEKLLKILTENKSTLEEIQKISTPV